MVKDQSYFIQGKYDYNKRDVPYSAIAIAFTDMIHQVCYSALFHPLLHAKV